MSTHEFKPIDTATIVLLELRPDGGWHAVPCAGPDRITVGVRALNRIEVAECKRIEDGDAQNEYIAQKAISSVQCGSKVLDSHAIPWAHFLSLTLKIGRMSATGANPFSEAPAES